ncbi:hypothetical protein FF38_13054 [Lucilia cuprina]|uniref:Uncharacterized protein n=1 Tax=Lucilia cuprina TaxID=7375 RepID=A0A0L0BMT1_LUCCU|nr:hypothetical protein FF38_13054 [Lucilia cuprina]
MSGKIKLEDNSNDIVITGVSGLYPNSKNVKEFEYNLYNKIDMIDDLETRWKHIYPGVPRMLGKIPYLNKFDATFFGIHQSQADQMDFQMRILLEESYKAIMDAGVNPTSLRNTNTGVYIAACASESDSFLMYCENSENGFGLLGSSKSLLANRISFVLGLNGPSQICDTACSSSMYALNIAYEHMKNGIIDAAIVGGTNGMICPFITAKFAKLGVLSLTGKCRPFDDDANGYVRSEAISCIFLQRKRDAKRVYGTLVHSATNCDGFKAEGLTYPSGHMQMKLLSKFYDDINLDLNELGYMEAHSTGTVVGDPEECKAIDQSICKRRNSPLHIGSVKSNCGHAEGSSGIVSLTKVLFTLNNNCIPPNINFSKPRKAIEGIQEGRLLVVTEKTELKKPYVCINSFGFGGANAHALLKQHTNEHPVPSYGENDLPYLLTWSSRTEENIKTVFDSIESQPFNLEHLALMHSSQAGGIKGMLYRGYNILKSKNQTSKPEGLSRLVQYNDGVKYPIVWVFSGMGSQWVGMGRDLMKIKVCSESILKSHATLKSKGLDLINILTSDNIDTYENILHCFVGIAAIQIALTDLLRLLQIKPDFIIGHSAGEVGCSYADGCLTAEQAILAAYYRGKVSIDVQTIRGSMAAVGLGFRDIKPMLPSTITVACHNSSESCTISGPVDDVSSFVEFLKSKNIFAKEVPCGNIAYHSKYIQQFAPELLKHLKEVITNPKLRSERWISTSVPSDKWLLNDSKFCSAEYHTNNLRNSVLFEEAATYLPKNTIMIEVAPHSLLQSIMKTCNPDGIYIGLTRRNAKNNALHLLESLGNLYINGCELSINELYPPVKWPVSRGTPSLSNFIEFDHSYDHVINFYEDDCIKTGNKTITIAPNSEHKYLFGHEIDGRPLVPATFYIESVWKSFAIMHGTLDFETFDVEFENVRFLRATTLSAKDQIKLQVSIQRGTGVFEITESKTIIASGVIRKIPEKSQPPAISSKPRKENVILMKKDFYKELKLRGYHYNGDFQSVELAYGDGSYGKINWFHNWVAFMDCMLQLSIVQNDSRNLALPVKLRSMRIYANYHKNTFGDNCEIEAYANSNRVVAGGIEIIDLKASHVQRRKPPGEPVLEKYQFIPNFEAPRLTANDISRCCIQLYLENFSVTKCSVLQAVNSPERDFVFLNGLMQAINDLPTVQGGYMVLNMSPNLNFTQDSQESSNIKYISSVEELEGSADILLLDETNLTSDLLMLESKVSANSMVLIKTTRQSTLENSNLQKNYYLISLLPCLNSSFSILILLKRQPIKQLAEENAERFIKISEYDNKFQWINELKSVIGKRVVLVAENEKHNGLIGLVNCLRKEPETPNIRCVFIDDMSAPGFDPNLPFYKNQLKLGLAINVYRQGQWGSYRHLELKPVYPAIEHRDHICGAIGNIGDFSTLHWQEGPFSQNNNKIRIAYSALNFRDVMHASGRLSAEDIGLTRLEQSYIFGLEYSGIDEKSGKPVMGMALHSAVASHMEPNSMISWEVPNQWTLREAATVPVVYTTVYYAFFYTVDIRTGKDILIHSGSGGVGIAAIRTAIAYGLEVYTTVSTLEKKKFLLQTFPQLKEENIGNSRDCSFEEMIKVRTHGRGVDFILNSLSEDKLKASLRCLAPNGHFLEIGKFDMANDSNIGLGVFFQGQSFHAILADKLEQYAPQLLDKIKRHVAEDIQNGIVKPLPSTIFKPSELEHAFRYLMTAKHIGKVLIEIRPDVSSPATYPVSVTPKVYFHKELVYVVPGGLGGFGLELVDWMILRGARKIVLNSRRGLSDNYQKHRISIWNSYECQIRVNTSDITKENGCLELLTDSMKLGSIGGILNLAVLLKDGIFSNQTIESFQQSMAPKAFATKYLDKLSRKLCPKLHCFVIFSSVSCGRGNAGQTNYGMANSMMERIVEERVSHGYPAKAIQWGAIGEVGLVAVMAEGKIDLNIGGTLQQRISSCLEVLDVLMTSPDPIVCSMVVAEKKIMADSQTALQFVLNTLSLTQLKSISVNSTLSELGMDSLMGVEIKQTLERNFDITLSPAELRALTIERLKELSELHKKKSVDADTNDDNSNFLTLMESFYFNVTLETINSDYMLPVNNVKLQSDPVIIFPGIEGICTKIWTQIGMQLKSPAYVVQFLTKFDSNNFISVVKYTVDSIAKLLNDRGIKKFRIVAYSFGTLIAHIVIKNLEKLGYTGSIIYIDGSPIWVENISKEMKTMKTFEIEKQVILLTLKSILTPEQMVNFHKILSDNSNLETIFWNIKQNLTINNVDECLHYLNAVLSVTEAVMQSEMFKSVEIIESKLLMISPTKLLQPNLDKFYGLKPVTRNVIDVTTLEGDHQTILQNVQIPKLINQYFDK